MKAWPFLTQSVIRRVHFFWVRKEQLRKLQRKIDRLEAMSLEETR